VQLLRENTVVARWAHHIVRSWVMVRERECESWGRGDERCNDLRVTRTQTIQKWLWSPQPFFNKKPNNIGFFKKTDVKRGYQHFVFQNRCLSTHNISFLKTDVVSTYTTSVFKHINYIFNFWQFILEKLMFNIKLKMKK